MNCVCCAVHAHRIKLVGPRPTIDIARNVSFKRVNTMFRHSRSLRKSIIIIFTFDSLNRQCRSWDNVTTSQFVYTLGFCCRAFQQFRRRFRASIRLITRQLSQYWVIPRAFDWPYLVLVLEPANHCNFGYTTCMKVILSHVSSIIFVERGKLLILLL